VRYLALFKGKGQGEGSFFSRVAHKVSLYLLATDALQFPPAGDIALEKVDVGETTSQAAEQGGVDAIPGLGEVVHGPFAALADVDESRAAQVGAIARISSGRAATTPVRPTFCECQSPAATGASRSRGLIASCAPPVKSCRVCLAPGAGISCEKISRRLPSGSMKYTLFVRT